MQNNTKIPEESLERGFELLNKPEEDIISYLGLLSEEETSYQDWMKHKGIVVPDWNEHGHWLNFTSGKERGALQDWKNAGITFWKEKALPYIKDTICEDGRCKDDILALESDVKGLLKYLSGLIVGLLPISLPSAAISISIVIAALLIKKGLRDFCKS